jgi:hypothetical protein
MKTVETTARVLFPLLLVVLFVGGGYRYNVAGMNIADQPVMVLVKAVVLAVFGAVAVDLFLGRKWGDSPPKE